MSIPTSHWCTLDVQVGDVQNKTSRLPKSSGICLFLSKILKLEQVSTHRTVSCFLPSRQSSTQQEKRPISRPGLYMINMEASLLSIFEKIFFAQEVLKFVLLSLPPSAVVVLQRTCHKFNSIIDSSPLIQQHV